MRVRKRFYIALCMIFISSNIKAISIESLKRSISSCLNSLGAACHFLGQGKKADYMYQLQTKVASEPVKNSYLLRAFLLDTLNISKTACHFSAGKKAMNNDELSQSIAAFLHRSGNAIHKGHCNLNQYEGLLKQILDNTDLNKKSHLLATIICMILATHLSYKLYYNLVYKPLSYVGDVCLFQPTKYLCTKTITKVKEQFQNQSKPKLQLS